MSDEALAAEISPEQSPAFRLFDQDRLQNHPWRGAFADLASPTGPAGRWAVAENWQMDHRVSPERESGDLEASGHFESIGGAEDWWAARGLYFENEIRKPGEEGSAFKRPFNRMNRVQGRIAVFDKLVHVGCLNSLIRWASRSAGAADADGELRSLVGRGLPPRERMDTTISFASHLESAGEQAVREAVGILAGALADDQVPWWACFAEEVLPWIERGDASALCAALGLGHRRQLESLVVWVYPVSAAGPLYRPTVLEANDSPYHFPSPPGLEHGVTMPLRADLPVCREVVHPPLRGRDLVRHCTGRLLGLTEDPAAEGYDVLRGLRERHRQGLKRELAGGGAGPDHNPDRP